MALCTSGTSAVASSWAESSWRSSGMIGLHLRGWASAWLLRGSSRGRSTSWRTSYPSCLSSRWAWEYITQRTRSRTWGALLSLEPWARPWASRLPRRSTSVWRHSASCGSFSAVSRSPSCAPTPSPRRRARPRLRWLWRRPVPTPHARSLQCIVKEVRRRLRCRHCRKSRHRRPLATVTRRQSPCRLAATHWSTSSKGRLRRCPASCPACPRVGRQVSVRALGRMAACHACR